MSARHYLPAILRPGMYAGPQGERTQAEWQADAVDAYPAPDKRRSPRELQLIVPYGNDRSQNHFAWPDVGTTLCGRDRTGWSVVRNADDSDAQSPYTCKRCLAADLER